MSSDLKDDIDYLRLRVAELQTKFDARGDELHAVKAKLFGLQSEAAHTHVELGKINAKLKEIEFRVETVEEEI